MGNNKKQSLTPDGKACVISIANHKGGVAKTTTTLSVGYSLARRGYRVLLMDLDPQSNLTLSLLQEDAEYSSIYDAVIKRDEPLPLIRVKDTLDLTPSSLELSQLEISLTSLLEREYVITDKLVPLMDKYDFILIDCPPSLGIFTINALVASDYVLIPLTAEVVPYKGLGSMMTLTSKISERLNKRLSVLGIFFTRYKAKLNLTVQIESAVRQIYGPLLLETRIRDTVKVAEAPLGRETILEYAPKSTAATDYEKLVDELIERLERALEGYEKA